MILNQQKTEINKDYLCVKMAFVQMSVLGLSARVVWGDALTNEQEMTFDTPALQLALAQGYFQPKPKEQIKCQNIPMGQLTLF
jgi:hypothetical protein